MRKDNPGDDRRMELLIGNLLRIGVSIAAFIVGAGGIFYLVRQGGAIPRYGAFQGEPDFLEHVSRVVAAALALRSRAIIQLGLLLLIAVPIFRVAVSVVAFLLKRDWLYSVVTMIVLAVLLFALLGGKI